MASAEDVRHMARAIQLARRGLYTTHPNPRVGCVIVNQGQVVGEGWHERAGEPHAEVHALRQAGARARGGTAYVTLEPCAHYGRTPPCCVALSEAGIARVVVAVEDPNPQVAGGGLEHLRAAGVEVESGLLQKEAEALNPGFLKRMRQGLPWVRVKLAMSLDGRTAMASGESQWITGPEARADVQRLRARADAILTGIGTVLADDPSLNVRLAGEELGFAGEVRQPVRVVLDSNLRLPPTARLLSLPGDSWVMTTNADAERGQALARAGAEVIVLADREGRMDLQAALHELARRHINEVHVEAGAELAGALVQHGLADELVIYMAPTLMGDAARGLLHLPGLEHMADRIHLQLDDIRAVGRDWRITARLHEENH